jgi:hypothetical protein
MEGGSMAQEIDVGTRVRMLVPMSSGWMGKGTVIRHYSDSVTLMKDGYPTWDTKHSTVWSGTAEAMIEQVERLRSQRRPGTKQLMREARERLHRVEGFDLCAKGIFIPKENASRADRLRIKADQVEMLERGFIRQVEAALRCFQEYIGMPCESKGRYVSSLLLAQIATQHTGVEVSNGALIAAANVIGFYPYDARDYTCRFRVVRDLLERVGVSQMVEA